jgi:hypothetical protein
MSNNANANGGEFSMEVPQLTEEQFDAIFKAESKAAFGGDDSDAKKVAREIFAPDPKPTASATPVVTPTEEEAPLVTEPATDLAASVTDDGSTPNPEEVPAATEPTHEEATAWLAALDPAVKAQVDKLLAEKQQLEHKLKSDEGRVAAYQRHYDTARRDAEELRKRVANPQVSQPPANKPAATATTPSQPNVPKKIQEVMEADPVLGQILLDEHLEAQRTQAALKAEIDSLRNETLAPLKDRLEEMTLRQELDLLEGELPGAKQILSHDIWQEFKKYAPPALRYLAESSNRFEVATALHEYNTWINRPEVQQWAAQRYGAPDNNAATNSQTTASATTAQQPDPQKVAQALKVKQEAERKAASQPVGTTQVGRPATAKPNLDQILADPVLAKKFHDDQFEIELARVQGRKPNIKS